MRPAPRISLQGLKVLRVMLWERGTDGLGPMTGADVIREAKLSSGTMYPLLGRFEKSGILKSRWELGDPRKLGRPRRRFYWLTERGAKLAQEHLAEWRNR